MGDHAEDTLEPYWPSIEDRGAHPLTTYPTETPMAKVSRQTKKAPRRKAPIKAKTTSPPPKKSGSGWMGRRPFAFVGYGPSGVGKTSLAAHFPNVVFVHDPQETGIEDLVEFGQAPKPLDIIEADTWTSLLEVMDRIALGKVKGAETVVVDSLTGIEKLCFHHHCQENFEGDWSSRGFYSYQQGPKTAAKTDWPEFLDLCEACRGNGVNVFLVAHSTVKPYNNPEGKDWDRWIPRLEKDIWDATHRWAQAVFFLNHAVELDEKGARKKAKGDSERRVIFTEGFSHFDAKNRMGISPVLDMGDSGLEAYTSLKEAMESLG